MEKSKFYISSNPPCLSLLRVRLLFCQNRESELMFRKQSKITCFTLWSQVLGLPDSPSEAVLQRRGADIKDVDFGKPGVDAGHLSN